MKEMVIIDRKSGSIIFTGGTGIAQRGGKESIEYS
jgi:molybdopterin biosynthesis enzyme MoaB